MRDFFRHGAIVAAGLLGANVLTYVYYALVTRSIGVDQAGEFTSLISAMMLLSLPANVGGNVVAKLVADARGRGHPGTANAAMRQLVRWWFVFAIAVCLIGLAGATWIASFLHVSDGIVVWLSLAGFIFTFPQQPQRSIIQGAAEFTAYAFSYVLEAGAKTLAGIAAFVTGGGLRVAFIGYLVGVAGSFFYNAVLAIRRTAKAEHDPSASIALITSVLGIALPIGAITMISFTDVIIVQHFFPRTEAGLYGACALVGRAISGISGFVFVVLLPKVASRAVAGLRTTRLLMAAMLSASAILGSALLITGIFPLQVITLLAGKAFAPAAAYVFPYAVAMSAIGLAAILATYLIALGRVWFGAPLTAVAVGEVVALTFFHPDIWTVLHIVIIGHCAVVLVCVADVIFAEIQGPTKIAPSAT